MKKNNRALMKAQLEDMRSQPAQYAALLQRGYVCAGFGGELNGVPVPETLMQGQLPAGVSPQKALAQVMAFMQETILQSNGKTLPEVKSL